jgi:glutathione peroxidase
MSMRIRHFGIAVALGAVFVTGCAAAAGDGKRMSTEPTGLNSTTGGCPASLNFTEKTIDGEAVSLCKYQGNVVLVVNVASKCGYTPQYDGLEALNKKYRDRGLRILGFPSNDFGAQEPGSEADIKEFCRLNYGVTFDMFSKVAVKGEAKDPLYAYLTSGGGNQALAGEVKWNFQKYLIDRNGNLVAVFPSKVEPMSEELTAAVEKLL